jgi:hypothetical protein
MMIEWYLLVAGEIIEDEPIDDWCFADGLVAQQDHFTFHSRARALHFLKLNWYL